MGKHGSNVDTMIFAHVNEFERSVSLVSIPRDIYIEGRKLNSVYADYGILEQVHWVENLLGRQIDEYVLIDMYVFRDVIDLMGGVEVTLAEDLIDPHYRVCDEQGENCGTLFYTAGTHHLSGTAALRVARSRYTTSDYSRAARQQLILEGIQMKARELGFGDADALFSIISTVVNLTETSITVDEALRYYFRHQSFDVNSGYVLSSGNVLSSVKVPVEYLTSLVVTVCDGDETYGEYYKASRDLEGIGCYETYAIYTLQAKEGNWDAIPWWVSSVL
jgi:LCP family protein required for cell wall assembly